MQSPKPRLKASVRRSRSQDFRIAWSTMQGMGRSNVGHGDWWPTASAPPTPPPPSPSFASLVSPALHHHPSFFNTHYFTHYFTP